MTPLGDMLIGENRLFASQSHLAREISRIRPRDYPDPSRIRALINQICSGRRKVPDNLRQVIMDLLNGKPDHLVSAFRKEIDNHNKIIVPMMRKEGTDVRTNCKKYIVQDKLCRALVKARLTAMLEEVSVEKAAAQFANECCIADPEIGDGWKDLFYDLLREYLDK